MKVQFKKILTNNKAIIKKNSFNKLMLYNTLLSYNLFINILFNLKRKLKIYYKYTKYGYVDTNTKIFE